MRTRFTKKAKLTGDSPLATPVVALTPPGSPVAEPEPAVMIAEVVPETLPPPSATNREVPPAGGAGSSALAGGSAAAPILAAPKIRSLDPELLAEAELIQQTREESEHARLVALKRDKINAVAITIILHLLVLGGFFLVVVQVPRDVPPSIVAATTNQEVDDRIKTDKIKKPQLRRQSATVVMPDIISTAGVSEVAISSVEVDAESFEGVDFGMDLGPSMSFGAPMSSESMMMFGQKVEGEVLGVILDVSGSMAEFLPEVVSEVDRNFKNAPIVYVNNALVRRTNREMEVRPIVSEEVIPFREDRTHTPYWFLWHDLPRKAPQRYVDRLIKTFKTRPNQFIVVGGDNRITAAAEFLTEQKIDSLYIFSDFEDFVDEDLALELGQKMGRQKIKTYVQPAESQTEHLSTMTKKVANRSLGRQFPPLVALTRPKDDTPPPLIPPRPSEMAANLPVKYATPRPEHFGKEFYEARPNKNWTEITRLSEPEFDAVFYGPEARADIFLKTDKGYVQNPILFHYHSWKYIPEHPDPKFRSRRRKFLRTAEPPSFDGKEIVWKMILEDELRFDVHLYLDRKGMNATYVADPPKDGSNDGAFIYFRIPPLARERADKYFGYDYPPEGISLDEVRQTTKPNVAIFNLPNRERDRFGKTWDELGFKAGYDTKPFDELIRRLPPGVRDLKVQGPSFGNRIFHARTTSSKVLLSGGSYRNDIELWEGFHARLIRSADTRTRFTKTEAIAIEVE